MSDSFLPAHTFLHLQAHQFLFHQSGSPHQISDIHGVLGTNHTRIGQITANTTALATVTTALPKKADLDVNGYVPLSEINPASWD